MIRLTSHGKIASVLFLLTLASGALAHPRTVRVANVDELYAAVNDAANAGRMVVLAPGTYALTPIDATGAARPNGGRLEFQPDMSLRGSPGDSGAVVIDANDMPATSFPQTTHGVTTGPSAAVRMGRGRNSIEWLTVRNGRFAQANIDTGLQWLDPDPTYVRVSHVVSTGSTRGLNVLNFGPITSGQKIEVEIVDSSFFGNTLNLGEGIRLGNFQGARGSTVNARLYGNASWGQKQGLLVVNNRAIESTVNVLSVGNRFYENGGGTIISGGLSSNNTRADSNTINFRSFFDRFTGNRAATEFDHGGLVVLGTEDISAAGGGSSNSVNVELWYATLSDNDTADLRAIGARSLSADTAINNQNNRVTIEIHGSDKPPPVETFDDSLPAGPNYANTVNVIRCPSLFGFGRAPKECYR